MRLSELELDEQIRLLFILDLFLPANGLGYYFKTLSDKELNNLIREYNNRDKTKKDLDDLIHGKRVNELITDWPTSWATSEASAKDIPIKVKPPNDDERKRLKEILSGLSETVRKQAFLIFEFKLYYNFNPDPTGMGWNEMAVRRSIEIAKEKFEREGKNIRPNARSLEDTANYREQWRGRDGNPVLEDTTDDLENESDESDSDDDDGPGLLAGGKKRRRHKSQRKKSQRRKTKRRKNKT